MPKKRPEIDRRIREIIAEPVHPDAAIAFWQQRAKLTDAGSQGPGRRGQAPGVLCDGPGPA